MIGVAGALQMKNMSSGFMKEDRHSYWNRRPANVDTVMESLKAKRRKLYQKGPEDLGDDENENGDVTMGEGKLEDVDDKLAATQMKAEQAQEDEDNDSDNSNDSDDSATAERKADAKGKGRDNVCFPRHASFAFFPE